jgi:hypothetical protein
MQFIARAFAFTAVASMLACSSLARRQEPSGADRWVDLGTTTAELIGLRGQPERTRDRVERDRTFRTFYYADGTSYVVDLKKDIVCEQGIGETEGYCYPCDYGPSAGTCP